MEISANRIAILKIMEKEAFSATSLSEVAVKSAPWLKGEQKFGLVRPEEYRAGPFSVRIVGGGSQTYPSLDAMLDEWIGD